ncbi:MAG: acyltransferase [Sphingomonadaceae bacterium]|nr:acyltransferase [Sphingomonadaceae bacterium]
MDIAPGCRISFKAHLDRSYPRGVHIGPETSVSFGAAILTHDFSRGLHTHTRIGARCLIGAHALIMPGVTIGDHCVIGGGSVVLRDVPSGSLVLGNPARVIQSGLVTGPHGRILEPAERPLSALGEEPRSTSRAPHLTRSG